MKNQYFERMELKYKMNQKQKQRILEGISSYMEVDSYGRSVVRNIYFDTHQYRLIRHSIEKPVYKEKMRIRSYKKTNKGDLVFLEIKKKYKRVVYKRRVQMNEEEIYDWVTHKHKLQFNTQSEKEIDAFIQYYQDLHPVLYLSYEREAYYCKDDRNLRITFDENILFREEALTLQSENYGKKLLEEDEILMEIKCLGALPLWLTQLLSKEKLYKTSFSKYGMVYIHHILPKLKEDFKNGTI